MKTAGIGILSVLFLLLVACDPGELVRFRNETDELLFVQVNEATRDRLPPQTERNLGYLSDVFDGIDDPLVLIIADRNGCVVMRLDTTLRKFRDGLDGTVTIRPTDLPPPAERTVCDPSLAD